MTSYASSVTMTLRQGKVMTLTGLCELFLLQEKKDSQSDLSNTLCVKKMLLAKITIKKKTKRKDEKNKVPTAKLSSLHISFF